MSHYLWPHELQHARLLCPSLSPGVCSNSCPLSWWFHPTTLSPVTSFSSRPQSFPASRSFPMTRLFTSGGQSIGASASALVLPVNTQDWFPLGLSALISCCPRDSQESSLALSLLYRAPCMCLCLVAASCLTLCDPMDCSPPGSSVHGILQGEYWSCHFLLQGIFPTQGLSPGLLHCRQTAIHQFNRFPEHLLHVRPCVRCWGFSRDQGSVPSFQWSVNSRVGQAVC